ncbi:alginate export family protein [Algoriphagus sp. Y33]|uniref:alginate export family protein n=1 Tax=Algoriphagus sp. Y33 TaxID=2772483 RepID=UPI00178102EA|nr:alginate export family protein [Algoriphagus sp. Y33]
MKLIVCVLIFITFEFTAYGQEFSLLRQNDDLEMLDILGNNTMYQNIKAINLFQKTTLSVGGSWRFQAESFINGEFDSNISQDNSWYLNRFLLHTHLKVGKSFELFAELGSSLVTDKEDIGPVDKDELYVNQLFAKYQFTPKWDVSGGRYNMRLGSGRLVDIREGPNVRRAFDLVEFNYQTNNFKAKTFYSIPVQPVSGVFNNGYLNFEETFSGVYTTTGFSGTTNLDAYVLYQKENDAIYASGKENERRASVGIRHFGKYKKLAYNNEVVYQFGKFGDQTISAWTLSINVEREVNLVGERVNLGLKTEVISGDKDPADNKMNTFDALYPRGAYFGRVARFGPSNLIDVHPYINTYFNKWEVSFDYAAFWRYSLLDGVYGAALTLDYPAIGNGRFIAHQLGTIVNYRLNKFVFFELESNVIFPGEFLANSNREDTLYHFVFTSEIKF